MALAGPRVALIEAGSPGLNIYSHVAMGRGIALLAAVVRDAGYEVQAFIEDVSGRDSLDWDWIAGAGVVGFSVITCTMPRTIELLERVRRVAPHAVIVFGGPEATCAPERSLDAGADFVLRGEGELTFPRLLDLLHGKTGEPLECVPGLVWREADAHREGPPPRQLTSAELDAVPPVDRSLIHHAERSSVASVWRTRGCPSRCDFCEVCEIWPRYAQRSPAASVHELLVAEKTGFPTSFLIDDNAVANRDAFKDFLRDVIGNGYLGMLVTQMRADAALLPDGRLDRELLRLLKRAAAVTVVCVGVESADDGNLEALHKRETSARMARALSAMRRYGLLVHGMLIAFDSDTRKVIRLNGSYARKNVTSLQYLFETPLPGTKRTAEHEAGGKLLFDRLEDLWLYDGMHVVLRPAHMAAIEMQALVLKEYERFYSLRRIVAAALAGAFLRFKRLTAEQRARLAGLPRVQRLRRWMWFHIQYKFAPVSFLSIGRVRVRAMLREPEYAAYLERLRSM